MGFWAFRLAQNPRNQGSRLVGIETSGISDLINPEIRDTKHHMYYIVEFKYEFIYCNDSPSQVIIRLARQFERQIPAEKRIKTSHAHRYLTRLGGVNSPAMQQRRRRSLTPVVGTMSPLAGGSMANIADTQSPAGIAHSTSHNGLFSASVAASARQRNSAAQQRRLARRLSAQQVADLNSQSLNEQYREVLRELQMSTYR